MSKVLHNTKFINEKAKFVRSSLFEKFVLTKQGHPGSVFSMVDLAASLYYGGFIRKDDENNSPFKDKVIVSKGHATATLYPILVDLGIIDIDTWNKWGSDETMLRVFGNISIPGIDVTSGSLGHGLGIAAGFAESFKRKKNDNKVFVFLSEGELYEGSCWESLLYISSNRLDNINIILDRNSLMILGNTEDCVELDPIDEKLKGFGIEVYSCNGHDTSDILLNYEKMNASNKPTCLIAKTIKGKGVSFMENKAHWHYWNPLDETQIKQARQDLS